MNTPCTFYNESIDLANYNYNKANFIEARKYFKYILTHNFKDRIIPQEFAYKFANTYFYEKEYEKCEKIYIDIANKMGKKNLKTEILYKILIKLAITFINLNKYDQCIRLSTYILSNYSSFNNDPLYNNLHSKIINNLINQKKYTITEQYCLKLVSFYIDNSANLFFAFTNLTYVSYLCNNTNQPQSDNSSWAYKMMHYHSLALKEYQKINTFDDYRVMCYLTNILNWNNTFQEINLSKIPESEFIPKCDFIDENDII